MRTSTVTPSTPSTMTRTITTRTICTSEHSSAPLVVFPVLMMCHTTLAQVHWVCHLHAMLHMCRSLWSSPTSLSTSTCPSPSSSTPLSWCTLTCTPTSTTWTPWKTTCATPPRGASTSTTSPTPSQEGEKGREARHTVFFTPVGPMVYWRRRRVLWFYETQKNHCKTGWKHISGEHKRKA